MIITSLNLYAFSLANNKEMGVLIDKNDPVDKTLFDDAYKEVDYINETSQRFDVGTIKEPFVKQKIEETRKNTGFCLRTGAEIPFNLEKPMSYEAFKSWSKSNDPEYPEKFCHFSGESSNEKQV
jgi:hypothetical protein